MKNAALPGRKSVRDSFVKSNRARRRPLPFALPALRAHPAQRQVKAAHFKACWQRDASERRPGGKLNISHFSAFLAEKVAMLAHVRAKPCRTAIQCNLPHQPALNQHAEAVVNSRKGDFRHPLLSALKNFVRRWVIVAPRHHVEHFLSLACRAKSARLERMLKFARNRFVAPRADG